jgi:hypothetical protein
MTREEFIRQEIAKYRGKIAIYQSMIAEWEAELGIPSLAQATVKNDDRRQYEEQEC